ncbi:MAG TPA: hypothetical protein VGW14_00200 [Thermoleophilaceae bacterium]|nr:hypothetical protein [Thermoleophilaceae bacterium]
MGSSVRSACLVVVAMALAAIPAVAQPEGSHRNDAVRAGAASQQPDLHRWRMTRHGFGRLKVGLNRAKIERRTGRKLRFSYNTGSCAIWGIRGVRGLGIMTIRGRLARVDAYRGTWRTSTGIQIGDSESTVRERYPRLRTEQHPYDPDGEYLIVRGPNRRVVFETNGDDQVTSFRGGRVPEIMYIEGCA